MKVFLVGLLMGCLHISSGKDDTTTVTPETTTTVSICLGLATKGCEACTASASCYFVSSDEAGVNVCLGVGEPLPGEVGDWRVYYHTSECGGGGEDPYTTQPTPPDTTTEPGNTTTTTTTTTSTTTDTTTTTTTITTSTTTTLTTSTTTITTTSTTPASNSTTSTTTTTTTTKPASTVAPQPGPDAGRGSFDGWSFFGGILLTLGLAAIGLVGYKYYRLRSGTAGNYNRF